jgi:protein-S-isoprenylcysteine O-methyltransferase Ste14
MGYPRKLPSHSWFVSIRVAYLVCFCLFMLLAMIFVPRMLANDWHGWAYVSVGLFVIAVALFLVGIALLSWAFLQFSRSRSVEKLPEQTSPNHGVWDRQFDG